MKAPICFFVKSTAAHYWYCVERGVWTERAGATRFLSRDAAREIMKMLKPTEHRGHRVYVAAVYKRTPHARLRRGIERIVKTCRPCTNTSEDGCTGCHIVEELELLLERTSQPSSPQQKKDA